MKATQERNDDQVRHMTEERMRLEGQLTQLRADNERYKLELQQKGTQLDIMGHTLEGAGL
jgi:hypothetical protein